MSTVREIVTASRARQGLPAQVADPAVLRRLAALLSGSAPIHRVDGPAGAAGRDVATGGGRDRSDITPKVPARRRARSDAA